MKKKLFLCLLITLSTLFCTLVCANAEDNINVTLNDEVVTFDSAPVMENDRILVPIRAIAEKMEFDVNWDQDTETVTLENFSNILTIGINNNYITKTFKFIQENSYSYQKSYNIPIDVAAKVINDRTYLPLRAITEAFGAEVNWKGNSQTAEIFYGHTYGKEVIFEDEGIEYLAKVEILLNELKNSPNYPVYDYELNYGLEFWDARRYIYIDEIQESSIFNKISLIKIHEGDLKNIEYLGMNYINSKIDNKIFTLEDFKKFPNLRGIFIYGNITDITPLSYIKEWDYIRIDLINPKWYTQNIFNYDVLSQLKSNIDEIGIYPYYSSAYYFVWHKFEATSQSYNDYLENFFTTHKVLENIINDNINDNMTRTEKIIAINNWICDNVEYDYSRTYYNSHFDNNITHPEQNSLDCAVIHHYAQCGGYADTFQVLCEMLNIPCEYIGATAYGTSDGINFGWDSHAWNLVQLEDGNFYHVDSTWNDSSQNKYLLLTDEELEEYKNHIWDKDEANEYLKELCTYFDN